MCITQACSPGKYTPHLTCAELILCRWFCQKNVSDALLYELFATNATLLHLAETSTGCFDQASGQLSQTTGQFQASTSHMLPFTSYSLTLRVSKDVRVTEYTQSFYVAGSEPPIVTIRCRENCGERKRSIDDIVMRADCLERCTSTFGGAVYKWVLIKHVDEDNVLYENIDLGNITYGGVVLE